MKIKDIKDPQIRALAWKYRKANNDEYYDEDTVREGFNWLKTKEGAEFWVDVCIEKPIQITEKMKADHPEIFLKQEEMKTTHTLKNGTVLEVGKRYIGTDWDDDVSLFTEILYIGNKKALLRDNNGEEYECYLSYLETLIPYEEPKEKIFDGYKPYIRHSSVSDLITLEFKKTRPRNETHAFYYTIEEAEEQGLDLSIFNI